MQSMYYLAKIHQKTPVEFKECVFVFCIKRLLQALFVDKQVMNELYEFTQCFQLMRLSTEMSVSVCYPIQFAFLWQRTFFPFSNFILFVHHFQPQFAFLSLKAQFLDYFWITCDLNEKSIQALGTMNQPNVLNRSFIWVTMSHSVCVL